MSRFDVTKLPMNMRTKIMVSMDPKLTNGSVCWEWTGATNSRGYGCVTNGKGRSMLSHRRAYMELVGEIPAGLTIDHLCFNKVCVNTDHMEPVSIAENTRRASARKTHCAQGHPLSGDNMRLKCRKNGWKQRVCITCEREVGKVANRRYRARLKLREVA